MRKPVWTSLAALALCLAHHHLAWGASSFALPVHGQPERAPQQQQQQTFPAPPADRTLVYVADETGALAALPFEAGATPIKTDEVAKSDKISYVEVKGASAATTVRGDEPRLYVFVPDKTEAHPPFLVRLEAKRGARRVTAVTQRGLRGYAIASEEIVKPRYRVLARDGQQVYMEIRPREPLLPGEYAIVGTDLQRIATFRVAGAFIP
ncbi:MAG TPA: hypothetical protein VGX92_12940 [Pyrinomonadaceae bacterium]|nr:hypothetical protein [Pyrinomonadaceae bacterium]